MKHLILLLSICLAAAVAPTAMAAQNVVFFDGDTWLGVGLADLTAERAAELKLAGQDGAEVKEVFPDSPAAHAGLQVGDVIVAFHGRDVESVSQLRRMVRETPSDRVVPLKLLRHAQAQTVNVKIARHGNVRFNGLDRMPEIKIPPMPLMPAMPPLPPVERMRGFASAVAPNWQWMAPGAAGMIGISVETMPRQLAAYFGTHQDNAVLVRSVEGGSIAATAGFHAGDVVLKVGEVRVDGIDSLRHALREHRHAKVAVTVLRSGKQMTLQVPALPAHEEGERGAWFGDENTDEAALTLNDALRYKDQVLQLRQQAMGAAQQMQRQHLDAMLHQQAESMRADAERMRQQADELKRQLGEFGTIKNPQPAPAPVAVPTVAPVPPVPPVPPPAP